MKATRRVVTTTAAALLAVMIQVMNTPTAAVDGELTWWFAMLIMLCMMRLLASELEVE